MATIRPGDVLESADFSYAFYMFREMTLPLAPVASEFETTRHTTASGSVGERPCTLKEGFAPLLRIEELASLLRRTIS
jgi:hypothetical protein